MNTADFEILFDRIDEVGSEEWLNADVGFLVRYSASLKVVLNPQVRIVSSYAQMMSRWTQKEVTGFDLSFIFLESGAFKLSEPNYKDPGKIRDICNAKGLVFLVHTGDHWVVVGIDKNDR
ncbi:hypothetical protein HK097_000629 [Rhizophlyctis rosea]|uniref:Uncharacterized protein n=1 Tax=Rhizophlyctis rosea TaxID=64517 RepID=A0AAD5S7W8_9FUNG|nr:hypothetical protein HK097_000629 [Rhizophlyctis rosea]